MFANFFRDVSTEKGIKPDYIFLVVTFVVSYCFNRVVFTFLLVARLVQLSAWKGADSLNISSLELN